MSQELMKSIEEMTDDEKGALAERISTPEFWDESDRAFEAGRALRRALVERQDLRTFAREDVVAVLNFAESIRISSHVVISIAADNIQRMHRALASAKCSYCDWVYRDELLEVSADEPLPEEEIASLDERVKAGIREHVKACPTHPMRELERQHANVLDTLVKAESDLFRYRIADEVRENQNATKRNGPATEGGPEELAQ